MYCKNGFLFYLTDKSLHPAQTRTKMNYVPSSLSAKSKIEMSIHNVSNKWMGQTETLYHTYPISAPAMKQSGFPDIRTIPLISDLDEISLNTSWNSPIVPLFSVFTYNMPIYTV